MQRTLDRQATSRRSWGCSWPFRCVDICRICVSCNTHCIVTAHQSLGISFKDPVHVFVSCLCSKAAEECALDPRGIVFAACPLCRLPQVSCHKNQERIMSATFVGTLFARYLCATEPQLGRCALQSAGSVARYQAPFQRAPNHFNDAEFDGI